MIFVFLRPIMVPDAIRVLNQQIRDTIWGRSFPQQILDGFITRDKQRLDTNYTWRIVSSRNGNYYVNATSTLSNSNRSGLRIGIDMELGAHNLPADLLLGKVPPIWAKRYLWNYIRHLGLITIGRNCQFPFYTVATCWPSFNRC